VGDGVGIGIGIGGVAGFRGVGRVGRNGVLDGLVDESLELGDAGVELADAAALHLDALGHAAEVALALLARAPRRVAVLPLADLCARRRGDERR